MRAATFSQTGPARDVLHVGEVPTPEPGPGEVRVRLAASGVNPSDVKRRGAAPAGKPAEFPFMIPHSDGAGTIDAAGPGVPDKWIGERVWTVNAQFKRAFGTAAECCVLPSAFAVTLPANTDFEIGACLGIPALTAYHAVMLDGSVRGKALLVQGGAGAVGFYAIQFAKRDFSVRRPRDLQPDMRLKKSLANDFLIDRALQKTSTNARRKTFSRTDFKLKN